MTDHYFAAAAVLLGIGIIIAAATYAHCMATSSIYVSTQQAHSDGSRPLPGNTAIWECSQNSALLVSIAREAARWSRKAQDEAYVWATVLLVVLLLVVLYYTKYEKKR